MKEYNEHYVAFLDIMGFKSLLYQSLCDDIYPIFDVLHTKSKSTLNFNGVQILAYNHIHHTILSDSIIIYINADIDDAFAALVDTCHRLQISLANRDIPILLRGGISKGDLFYEEDIIYGNGLTKAYLLESNLAKYPRIIFSGDTLEFGLKKTKYMFPYLKGIITNYSQDEDYMYFINYLIANMGINDTIQYFDRLKCLCNKYLNQEIENSLRVKYIWLNKKIDEAVKMYCNVDEYYKKLNKEKSEREFIEYNSRFSIYTKQIEVDVKIKEAESHD